MADMERSPIVMETTQTKPGIPESSQSILTESYPIVGQLSEEQITVLTDLIIAGRVQQSLDAGYLPPSHSIRSRWRESIIADLQEKPPFQLTLDYQVDEQKDALLG